MKLIQTIFFAIILMFGTIIPGIAEEKQATVLESISYQNDKAQGETVNFKLNGIHIPKIFAIKGEKPRVVFDFLDTRYSDLINKIIETEGDLVKRVRVGIHNEPTPKTRVVIDLAPKSDFTYEQDFIVQDNILTISIFDSSTESSDTQTQEVTEVKKEKVKKKVEEEVAIAAEKTPVVLKQVKSKQKVVVEKVAPVNEEQAAVATEVAEIDKAPVYPSAAEVFNTKTPAEQEPAPASLPEVKKEVEETTVKEDIMPADPFLLDITFEDSSNKGEMVMFKLNDFYPPIVFGIEKGNPRVVCDFLNTELSEDVTLLLESNGVYIDKIRTAKHKNPDKVRVVLDLVPNKNYDLQQVFFKEDNLFVIIVNSFDEELASLPEPPAPEE